MTDSDYDSEYHDLDDNIFFWNLLICLWAFLIDVENYDLRYIFDLILTSVSGWKMLLKQRKCPSILENKSQRVSNFKLFWGAYSWTLLRGAYCRATCHACYTTTIHFSHQLSSDQTPITFSSDNPVLRGSICFLPSWATLAGTIDLFAFNFPLAKLNHKTFPGCQMKILQQPWLFIPR